jgi:2Fe-2S ferredoxin
VFIIQKYCKVFFIYRDEEILVHAPIGNSILEIAHKNRINIEGICGGAMACATCHVFFDEMDYKRIDKPRNEELETLDLAFNVKKTSRLGCQVIITEKLEGIKIYLL